MVLHPKVKMQKNCDCCGRFFKPHPRVGSRQKSCGHPVCIKKRNLEAQKKWRKENPKYFQERYSYLREWRTKNRDYQQLWRAKRSEIQNLVSDVTTIKSIRFITPVILSNNEIQNLVVNITIAGTMSYSAMARVGEIQNTIDISP